MLLKQIKVLSLVLLIGAVFFIPTPADAELCENGVTVDSCPSIGQQPAANQPGENNGGIPDINPIGDFKATTGDREPENTSVCGKGGDTDRPHHNEVKVAFDFGCRGLGYRGSVLNPIVDIMFAIFRALSAGVGLVVIASIIVGGIQYSASAGNPQASAAAIKRIANSVSALLLYLFIFVIANFLVPGGLFK